MPLDNRRGYRPRLTRTSRGLSFPNQHEAALLTPVRDAVVEGAAGRPRAIDTGTVGPYASHAENRTAVLPTRQVDKGPPATFPGPRDNIAAPLRGRHKKVRREGRAGRHAAAGDPIPPDGRVLSVPASFVSRRPPRPSIQSSLIYWPIRVHRRCVSATRWTFCLVEVWWCGRHFSLTALRRLIHAS